MPRVTYNEITIKAELEQFPPQPRVTLMIECHSSRFQIYQPPQIQRSRGSKVQETFNIGYLYVSWRSNHFALLLKAANTVQHKLSKWNPVLKHWTLQRPHTPPKNLWYFLSRPPGLPQRTATMTQISNAGWSLVNQIDDTWLPISCLCTCSLGGFLDVLILSSNGFWHCAVLLVYQGTWALSYRPLSIYLPCPISVHVCVRRLIYASLKPHSYGYFRP